MTDLNKSLVQQCCDLSVKQPHYFILHTFCINWKQKPGMLPAELEC